MCGLYGAGLEAKCPSGDGGEPAPDHRLRHPIFIARCCRFMGATLNPNAAQILLAAPRCCPSQEARPRNSFNSSTELVPRSSPFIDDAHAPHPMSIHAASVSTCALTDVSTRGHDAALGDWFGAF
jgi:hypothetical protein